jgi:hypothetical protein
VRRAVFVFGVVAACGGGREKPPQPIGNQALATTAPGLEGAYRCSITEGEYKYPPFACAIRHEGGRLTLAKLEGSVRFVGEIQPHDGGFDFRGKMYCPWGDCTQEIRGVFNAQADHYVGSFDSDRMTVDLVRAGGTGGESYGGASYGGATYGNVGASGRPRNRQP